MSDEQIVEVSNTSDTNWEKLYKKSNWQLMQSLAIWAAWSDEALVPRIHDVSDGLMFLEGSWEKHCRENGEEAE